MAGHHVRSVAVSARNEGHVYIAMPGDAAEVAELLDAFNREFDTPTPGPQLLAERLVEALGSGGLVAWLVGTPAVAVALVSFRPSVWYPGPAALLEELYVQPAMRGKGIGSLILSHVLADSVARRAGTMEINVDEGDVGARRFYEAHGFRNVDADSGDRMFFYYRDLP
jgi:GNAT superfamily N-acetyltransferase